MKNQKEAITYPCNTANVVMHAYTVILLYPNSVSSSDVETYCTDIAEARHPQDAVDQARWQCLVNNGWINENEESEYNLEEFSPLYVFNGIAPAIAYSNYDRLTGTGDVPDRACESCGNGLWPADTGTHCNNRCAVS